MHRPLSLKAVPRPAVSPLLAASVACALVCPARQGAAQQPLTEEQRVVHVLNRLGYGPRPGDIARVKAMGIETYIDAQLQADRIPDPVADAKLARYGIVNMTFGQLMEHDRPAAARAVRRRESVLGKAQAAERRESLAAVEEDSAAPFRRTLVNPRVSAMVSRADRPRAFEIYDTRLLRAIYSERQLLEVMVDFWFNHFNISLNDPYLVTDYMERAIRRHALGKFEDLLFATAQHPAMLVYLDNWLSAAPAEVIRQRLEAWQPGPGEPKALTLRRRQAFFQQTKGLNENYARELMELHTLGVEGGYTQADVLQVARAFTGWTLTGPREDGSFIFEPLIHEAGDKVVLGQPIKAGGMDEGMAILRLLAHHPSTARFVSQKLVRRFVADDPPSTLVEAAAKTFRDTGGDIRAVLGTIFRSPEFFSPQYHQVKVKKPLEVIASALRALNAAVDFSLEPAMVYLDRRMTQMGEPLGRHAAPDGYPDVASAWISTNTLYQRLDFALELVSGRAPGVTVDLEGAHALFRELGLPDPAPEQLAMARRLLERRSAQRGMTGGMAMAEEQKMAAQMADQSMTYQGKAAEEAGAGVALEVQAVAAAILLGSPQFQKR